MKTDLFLLSRPKRRTRGETGAIKDGSHCVLQETLGGQVSAGCDVLKDKRIQLTGTSAYTSWSAPC
ncbi:hypothetical protein GQ600_7061 [Phytophthora cactorum]|nr:hypothetical protein GQ600_7061 [Phytophthora cactorum]